MPRKKKNDDDLILYVPDGATMRQIYDLAREKFTAADLQQFTEKMEGIPIQKVISQLEGIQRRNAPKRRKRA